MSWLVTYTFIGAQGTVGVGMLEDSPPFTETKAKERWKNGNPSCFLCRREKKKDKHMYAVRVSLRIHFLRTNSRISYSQETPASLIVSLLVSGSVWRGNSISYMLDSFFFLFVKAISHSGIFISFPLTEKMQDDEKVLSDITRLLLHYEAIPVVIRTSICFRLIEDKWNSSWGSIFFGRITELELIYTESLLQTITFNLAGLSIS